MQQYFGSMNNTIAKKSGVTITGRWELVKKFNNELKKRWGHTTVLYEEFLYLVGGTSADASPKDQVLKIHCSKLNAQPQQVGKPLASRQSHTCTIVGDSIFLLGGSRNDQVVCDILKFKLDKPFQRVEKVEIQGSQHARESHTAVALKDRFILVFGGFVNDDVSYADFIALDTFTSRWQPVRYCGTALQYPAGCTLTWVKDIVYLFGGEGEKDDQSIYSDMIHILIPTVDCQNNEKPVICIEGHAPDIKGKKPRPRASHSSVSIMDRYLIVLGGQTICPYTARQTLLNDVWIYDCFERVWSEMSVEGGLLLTPKSNFSANLLNNQIIVFGGVVDLTSYDTCNDLAVLHLDISTGSDVCYLCTLEDKIKEERLAQLVKKWEVNNSNTLNTNLAGCRVQPLTLTSSGNLMKLLSQDIGQPTVALANIIHCLWMIAGMMENDTLQCMNELLEGQLDSHSGIKVRNDRSIIRQQNKLISKSGSTQKDSAAKSSKSILVPFIQIDSSADCLQVTLSVHKNKSPVQTETVQMFLNDFMPPGISEEGMQRDIYSAPISLQTISFLLKINLCSLCEKWLLAWNCVQPTPTMHQISSTSMSTHHSKDHEKLRTPQSMTKSHLTVPVEGFKQMKTPYICYDKGSVYGNTFCRQANQINRQSKITLRKRLTNISYQMANQIKTAKLSSQQVQHHLTNKIGLQLSKEMPETNQQSNTPRNEQLDSVRQSQRPEQAPRLQKTLRINHSLPIPSISACNGEKMRLPNSIQAFLASHKVRQSINNCETIDREMVLEGKMSQQNDNQYKYQPPINYSEYSVEPQCWTQLLNRSCQQPINIPSNLAKASSTDYQQVIIIRIPGSSLNLPKDRLIQQVRRWLRVIDWQERKIRVSINSTSQCSSQSNQLVSQSQTNCNSIVVPATKTIAPQFPSKMSLEQVCKSIPILHPETLRLLKLIPTNQYIQICGKFINEKAHNLINKDIYQKSVGLHIDRILEGCHSLANKTDKLSLKSPYLIASPDLVRSMRSNGQSLTNSVEIGIQGLPRFISLPKDKFEPFLSHQRGINIHEFVESWDISWLGCLQDNANSNNNIPVTRQMSPYSKKRQPYLKGESQDEPSKRKYSSRIQSSQYQV